MKCESHDCWFIFKYNVSFIWEYNFFSSEIVWIFNKLKKKVFLDLWRSEFIVNIVIRKKKVYPHIELNINEPQKLGNRCNRTPQVSTLCPLSFFLCPLSFVLCPLSFVLCPFSFLLCPLSFVLCPLSFVLCPLSSVLCPLSSALCPLSSVLCALSFVLCPLSLILCILSFFLCL